MSMLVVVVVLVLVVVVVDVAFVDHRPKAAPVGPKLLFMLCCSADWTKRINSQAAILLLISDS